MSFEAKTCMPLRGVQDTRLRVIAALFAAGGSEHCVVPGRACEQNSDCNVHCNERRRGYLYGGLGKASGAAGGSAASSRAAHASKTVAAINVTKAIYTQASGRP